MKKDPKIIRVGDTVIIKIPKSVKRVGYPKSKSDYTELAKLYVELSDFKYAHFKVKEKLVDAFSYALLHRDHFGGAQRQIFFETRPSLEGQEAVVEKLRTVMTGVYFPPTGSGEDWEPGGLSQMKAHRLATLDIGWELPVDHLVKASSKE